VNEPLSAVILADLSAAFFIRRFSGGLADLSASGGLKPGIASQKITP